MITFNDSHKVSESNPIPYEVPILVKTRFCFRLAEILKDDTVMSYPEWKEVAFDIEDITHFQRIEE